MIWGRHTEAHGMKVKVKVTQSCHVRPFATPQTVVHQALLSLEFSRQERWSGQPFPSPGDLPNPGIKPVSPALAGGFFTSVPLGKPRVIIALHQFLPSLDYVCFFKKEKKKNIHHCIPDAQHYLWIEYSRFVVNKLVLDP